MIAYYLPQFYTFPQNDEWWGHGFTEWTNVKRASPQYDGHCQPNTPVDELGYYELLSDGIFEKQIRIAKLYGVFGFCFYFYMFNNETRLLEKPLDKFLENRSLKFPFCLLFVNESWTRSWEGDNSEVLIEQSYDNNFELNLAKELKKYLKDSRYILVDKKPLIIIYRIHLLPNKDTFAAIFREFCYQEGIGEIYLCSCFTNGGEDGIKYGFDDNVEFPPHNVKKVAEVGLNRYPHFRGKVFSYEKVIEHSINYSTNFQIFRGAMLGWDNTPRRLADAGIYHGATPALFQKWLEALISQTMVTREPSKRIIFINSWNEWAESSYLEPDIKNGYAYLNAVQQALVSQSRCKSIRKIFNFFKKLYYVK